MGPWEQQSTNHGKDAENAKAHKSTPVWQYIVFVLLVPFLGVVFSLTAFIAFYFANKKLGNIGSLTLAICVGLLAVALFTQLLDTLG